MAGGIFVRRPFHVNPKCIIISVIVRTAPFPRSFLFERKPQYLWILELFILTILGGGTS